MEYNRTASCADRIKTALSIRGMKQSDLCRLTKIPKSALSQYISGAYDPKQDRIYLISRALNVSEAWLMGLDVPMERTKENNSHAEQKLTEGEEMWLELYHKLSSETREQLIETISSFNSLSEDNQKLALQMLRALGGQ